MRKMTDIFDTKLLEIENRLHRLCIELNEIKEELRGINERQL